MRRLLFVLLVFALALAAANFKLYLKDGSFQLVREYKLEGDRVQYYSIERSDWEEIPVGLVDLKRTDAETGERKNALEKEQKQVDDEKAAALEERREILKIPRDPGVYQLEDGRLRIFKAAEVTVHNAKKRNVLSAIAPLPVITGKATMEIPGEHSTEAVKDSSPEFFFQLAEFEPSAIVKLTPEKGVRIVERITIAPVTKETVEERTTIPIFTRQLSENGLYKIWPQDPLEKGEYALIEYTEGKFNAQIWDFRIE
jgi:hypothetical protein